MSVDSGSVPKAAAGRGFVLGELLVAALLLVVAISSLTALMYSVTRNPRARSEVECTAKGTATAPKCVALAKGDKSASVVSGDKLLRAGCATRSGARIQACNDSVLAANGGDATILKSRTDSASLALLPKKPKRAAKRPDLGFIR